MIWSGKKTVSGPFGALTWAEHPIYNQIVSYIRYNLIIS